MIRYAFSGDEIVPAGATPVALDEGDFWGGAALCGVAVAIAASVVPARPAFAAEDDFVAPAAPASIVYEDYPPVAVSTPVSWLRLYLPDADEVLPAIPAPSLAPDEDFWAQPRPWPAQTAPPRVFAEDGDAVFAVAVVLAPDEDFWAPPTQPWPAFGKIYLPDADELAVTAAAPATVVDEDAWAPPPSRAAPWTARIFADDSEVVAPVVTLAAEEDAWQPRVATPAPWPRLYLPDAEDAPAGFLRGMPDEDFWSLAPRTVVVVSYFQPPTLFDSDAVVPQPIPTGAITLVGIVGQQDAYSLFGRQDAATLLGRVDLLALTGRVDSYGLLGLQDTYSLSGANMPLSALVTVPLGDDVVIPMTLQDSTGAAFNLTGCTITVGVKKQLSDSVATISKTIANSGVVVTNAAGGLANLVLSAADTSALGAGAYPFDVQVTNASAKKATLIIGTFTFTDHPTR